jgi:hypothetical protein
MNEPIEPDAGNRAPDTLPALIVARAVTTAPISADADARTVEVVWSTGARAQNFVPGLGEITEELEMSPGAVRMAMLSSGNAPVLNTHRRSDATAVLGRVVEARIERGIGTATLRFSAASDVEPVWQRVLDGSLRNISVGYRVFRYEQRPDATTGKTIHRAVDWEPFEISVVPIPVDRAASVRGEMAADAPDTIVPTPEPKPEEQPMPDVVPPATPPATQENPVTTTLTTPAAPVPAPAPAAPPAPDLDAIRAEAERAVADRMASYEPVLAAARGLIGDDSIDAIRQSGLRDRVSAEVLRGRLWEAFTKASPPPSVPARPEPGTGQDSPAAMLDAMAEALAARSMPGYQPQGNGRHAEFMGWRPSDMIGELLKARGERNVPRNPAALAERAFTTTSDFPLLLSAAANKMLLAAYQPAAPTYRTLFLRRDFRDFKPHRHLRVGDFPTLLPLSENGEIQAGTMSESQELVFLQTFARRIRVTRPMLVNDDLGAFTEFAAMIGRRVADFENATAYALLNTATGDGPTLATGAAPVFATGAARLNKASAGTILDLTNLAAGRAAVMRQKTLDGLPISIGASMRLVVGPNQELAARQLTVSVQATQTSNANVYAGFVQPLVEPLIPTNRWYLFSDPAASPVYVYGYLNGAEGPQVTTGPVSGVDGIEVSVIFDFGVGAIDWRGAWFNPGT